MKRALLLALALLALLLLARRREDYAVADIQYDPYPWSLMGGTR